MFFNVNKARNLSFIGRLLSFKIAPKLSIFSFVIDGMINLRNTLTLRKMWQFFEHKQTEFRYDEDFEFYFVAQLDIFLI